MHPDGLFDGSLVVGDSGGLANVVLSIRADDRELTGPVPNAPAVLDQKGCQYVPHVIAVMVGQPILVKNSDPFLHNVHSLSIDNPAFNFGQPNVDPGRKVSPMKVAERFKIKCDVHPWMSAYVSVFDHPYFAVSGPDGSFAIPGSLPDGQYTVVAWHEKLGEKQLSVDVKDGKSAPIDFAFEASALRE
jgi:plastocyanin